MIWAANWYLVGDSYGEPGGVVYGKPVVISEGSQGVDVGSDDAVCVVETERGEAVVVGESGKGVVL